jgi:hypothetical protein
MNMYKSDPETLVDHLRDIYANKWGVVTKPLPSPLCAAAADEIERLRALVAANDELRKAAEEAADRLEWYHEDGLVSKLRYALDKGES